MKVTRAIALATLFAQVAAAAELAWTPCSFLTYPTTLLSEEDTTRAQCTTYKAPLCHPRVCETPDAANSTIDVFVKRLPAMDAGKAPSVWVLQSGASYSPDFLDLPMMSLYAALKQKVNVYTMDPRGIGRSTHLSCSAVSGGVVEESQTPACAKELEEKYGDLAAFSTTSAAKDLVSFIADYGNDLSTTVYGVGYGSTWVERIMQLDPPEVTGYVLDGIPSNMSSLNVGYSAAADAFGAVCAEDKACSARFKGNDGLQSAIQQLYTNFDKNPSSTCAKLLGTGKGDPASSALRYVLGLLLKESTMRSFIAPIVYRLQRCAAKDVDVLSHFINRLGSGDAPEGEEREAVEVDDYSAPVLSSLVIFSEMWESPTPSVEEMKAEYDELMMGGVLMYEAVPAYCAFSKEKSPACDKLKLGDYEGNGIVYERDEFYNKPAAIPDQASVLIMSSEMDPTAPHKNAEALLASLRGDKKELVTFGHTTQISLVDPSTSQDLCGMAVLSSFVESNGDLTKLNKTCVADEEMAALTPDTEYLHAYLSTDDAYDGSYDESLSKEAAGESSGSSTKTSKSIPLKDLLGSGSIEEVDLEDLIDGSDKSSSGSAVTIEGLKKMLKEETSLLDSDASSKTSESETDQEDLSDSGSDRGDAKDTLQEKSDSASGSGSFSTLGDLLDALFMDSDSSSGDGRVPTKEDLDKVFPATDGGSRLPSKEELEKSFDRMGGVDKASGSSFTINELKKMLKEETSLLDSDEASNAAE